MGTEVTNLRNEWRDVRKRDKQKNNHSEASTIDITRRRKKGPYDGDGPRLHSILPTSQISQKQIKWENK